jgi:hypothetical protein
MRTLALAVAFSLALWSIPLLIVLDLALVTAFIPLVLIALVALMPRKSLPDGNVPVRGPRPQGRGPRRDHDQGAHARPIFDLNGNRVGASKIREEE